MGFWKVLGCAALGVGAVAAAPFTGGGSILGAATLAGSLAGAGTAATVAGVGGAVVGAVLSEKDEEEKEALHREGEKEAEAKYALKVQKLEKYLMETVNKLREDKHYFQLILALFAVGMATANADGEVTEEEVKELEEFVAGVANSHFPSHIKNMIQDLESNPPTFNEAMEYVKELGDNVDIKLFETVIKLVAYADGCFSRDEQALLDAFRKAVA